MNEYESDSYEVESVASQMSDFSVSVNGQEMKLDEAVDDIFSQIQTAINQIHVDLRNLCQSDDRGDTYDEAMEYHTQITEHVKEGAAMFKSIIAVSKQLLPAKPKGWKDPKKVGASQEKLDSSFKAD
jgi:hypothetical protein